MPVHLLPASGACDSRSGPGAPTSRRAFLARLALAVRPDGTAWYALVSDTHIAADPKAVRHGQVMADNLRAVVADILAQPAPPRGVVIDGDLALRDGQPGDDRTFLDLLAPLRRARLPIHLALGNRDDRTHFRDVPRAEAPPPVQAVIDRHVSVVSGPGLRLVLLDSLQRPNSTPGRLGESQLGWLAKAFDADPRARAGVRPPNLSTANPTAQADTATLLDVIQPRRKVRGTAYGHTHVRDHRPRRLRPAPGQPAGRRLPVPGRPAPRLVPARAPARGARSWSCAALAATGAGTAGACRSADGPPDRLAR